MKQNIQQLMNLHSCFYVTDYILSVALALCLSCCLLIFLSHFLSLIFPQMLLNRLVQFITELISGFKMCISSILAVKQTFLGNFSVNLLKVQSSIRVQYPFCQIHQISTHDTQVLKVCLKGTTNNLTLKT